MADPGIAIASVDVTNCDREPIHIPGAILPHGAMLVLDAGTLEVLQAAGDTSRLLGVPLEELLGQSAAVLFRPDQVENLRRLVAALDLVKPRHLLGCDNEFWPSSADEYWPTSRCVTGGPRPRPAG
jgi:chemotaxis family two-component system sensor kinase Cph1